jgi:hypothetical protein
VRKRVQVSYFAIQGNQIIVNGKLPKTDIENETDVEISFSQHLLSILFVSIYLIFGLLAIIVGISGNSIIFIFAGFLIAIGIARWNNIQKESGKDIQKYKSLISGILEVEK